MQIEQNSFICNGHRYIEFDDPIIREIGRSFRLKKDEALLVYTDGKREFAVVTDVSD